MKRTAAYLKAKFITGYKPTQDDYSDVFDSILNNTDSHEVKNISASDLDADYKYSYAHNKGASLVKPILFDNNGMEQPVEGLFQIIDNNNIALSFNNPVEGTWTLALEYWL